jgi:FAD/FMN-containing dehydrogenase
MYAGSNNIVHGVTIDLGYMNGSWYDPQNQIASIQPGGRWRDVYKNLLDTADVMVTGGRDGDVGVGGFLLGGGNSYHTGTTGFGCDTVVNFEIVLSNGTILDANATSHADLYKALKGGGLNFGIVTRFDMQTMPAIDLAYGRSFMSAEHAGEVSDAIVGFTDRVEDRPHDHLFTIYTHTPEREEPVIMTVRVNTEGNLNTTSFDGITRIPTLQQSWNRISLAAAANSSQLQVQPK